MPMDIDNLYPDHLILNASSLRAHCDMKPLLYFTNTTA